MRLTIPALVALSISITLAGGQGRTTMDLDWFSPGPASIWTQTHCDLQPQPGAVRATFWKGYATTGFETTRPPVSDWSRWKSFRFDVENPYPEAFSVYVRISNRPDHPAAETYTGGTFDGFVIGPGRNTVEIRLEGMRSPEERPIDPRRIGYVGIFLQPLFLRDGMDLKFLEDKTLRLSSPQLSLAAATLQRQPYGDLLFRETRAEPGGAPKGGRTGTGRTADQPSTRQRRAGSKPPTRRSIPFWPRLPSAPAWCPSGRIV